jgi:glycosyltransferase involved in cell wall biosynthesis
VRISIVTPSFRSSKWLKLCIASVADQQVQAEHIVQDAGSDDGTLDWLLQDQRVRVSVERDQGMYDAINRGLTRAGGELLAYLNCDEQYLPGALAAVLRFFEQNPHIDVLFGDIVMVAPDGQYVRHRKVQAPLKYHTWACHLSTLSCATFFRRGVFFDRGFKFNARLRDVGDGEWMLRLLQSRVPMATLASFTSAFTCTGANMSAGPNARRENSELAQSAPLWARQLKPLVVLHHRVRRFLGGMYSQGPFSYQIFTLANPERRQTYRVVNPASRHSKTGRSIQEDSIG